MHFANNDEKRARNEEGYDRLFLIRPLINLVNKNIKRAAKEELINSVDEMMVPFKGHHSLKVYMAKKPHKWGYKIWARAGISGYVRQLEVYGDNLIEVDATLPDGIGKSGEVVVRACHNLESGSYVYFDNFFTSMELLRYFKQKGIRATGTARRNRIRNSPLLTEKIFCKKVRGFEEHYTDEKHGILVCQWNDNRPVVLATNCHSVQPMVQCKRYDKKLKDSVMVSQPKVVWNYNKGMGGVDKTDMLISLYRNKMKGKKWYRRVFFHFMDMAVVNAWLLFRSVTGSNQQLAFFKLEIATCLLAGVSPNRNDETNNRERQVSAANVPPDVRYDMTGHFFQKMELKNAQRCKMPACTSKTRFICIKCKLYLCVVGNTNCFYKYHHKN